jgi:hypothetical protein
MWIGDHTHAAPAGAGPPRGPGVHTPSTGLGAHRAHMHQANKRTSWKLGVI